MGGIFGKLNFDRASDIAVDVPTRMGGMLAHRGAQTALWLGCGVALGERTDDVGGAPREVAANPSREVHVAADAALANGASLRQDLERRGHRFRDGSDGEVIAHAYDEWGEGCVERLRGPFAFALWDNARDRLILARDHVGIRPLYFALLHGDALVFASEARAILEDRSVSRECRPEAIDAYLTLGYVPAPFTMFRAISKLEPSHVVVTAGHALRMRQYWDFARDPAAHRSDADLIDTLAERLQAAVALDAARGHNRVLQSGGTASTALLAAAAHTQDGFGAIAVGVDRGMAEVIRVAESGRHVGGHPEVELVTPEVEAVAPRLARCLDEPCADPSILSQHAIFAAARVRTSKVLAGHGAAALWAGYPRHRVERLEAMLRAWLGTPLATLGGRVAGALPGALKGTHAISHLALPPSVGCAIKQAYGLFDDVARHALYTRTFAWDIRDANPLARHVELYGRCASADPLTRALYVEARTFLPDNTLMMADRMSAAASIDVAYPYLHWDLLQLAAETPSTLKQRGHTGMFPLRQLLSPMLSEALMPPAQQAAAQRPWLSAAVTAMAPDYLLNRRFDARGIFSRPAIARVWNEHRRGRRDHTRRLWALLMLELWFRESLEGGVEGLPLEYAVLKAA